MEKLRCVIANLPQKMLADIFESLARESGEIGVLDRVNLIDEIPRAIANDPVDLVVMGMDEGEMPGACLEILDLAPDLTVFGLIDDGRRLAVFFNNVGRNDILKLIRILPRSGSESLQ